MILIFDMDGVIYRGNERLPGVLEALDLLKRAGHKIYYLTNNATQTRQTYLEKLAGMGIQADIEHIITSSSATGLYLKEIGAEGKRVYPVGEQGMSIELERAGMVIVEEPPADYVVVGLDRKFTYEKLLNAQQAIYHGAEFIATNRDTTYPLENDRIIPGGGSIVSVGEAASGKEPRVIGKPSIYTLEKIMALESSGPNEAVVIGDRLDTDILVGKRYGAFTVLMLTGVTSADQKDSIPDEMRPDAILSSMSELPAVVEGIRR